MESHRNNYHHGKPPLEPAAQKVWYLRGCSLFQKLSDQQLGQLERYARIRTFPRNRAIYVPSDAADCACLVATGRVRVCSITPDGRQAILAFVEPGELFGELALAGSGVREERAEAVVDSTIVLLPHDELVRLMEASAELTLSVTKLIGLRRLRIERRLRNLLFRSNRERLGHLLLELAEQYGSDRGDGIHLGIKLSHQDLASVIGVTRESVTVLLGEMQLEGLLKVGRLKLVITDIRRLAESLGTAVPSVSSNDVLGRPRPLPAQSGGSME